MIHKLFILIILLLSEFKKGSPFLTFKIEDFILNHATPYVCPIIQFKRLLSVCKMKI